jgi:SIR2-like domain
MDFDDLGTAISSGAAILLVGAGFSTAGHGGDGEPLPSTDGLIALLKREFGLAAEETVSLTDICEFANDDLDRRNQLRSILLRRLVSTSPSADQTALIDFPWRAIFTTNFDDIIERITRSSALQAVTPTTPASAIPPDVTPLYYLHGRARDLLTADINPSLIISETNYLDLGKSNRELYAKLNNEVFTARRLVVVGYSMKDLEIARGLLQSVPTLREKTTIVCHPGVSPVARARLEKFGGVSTVGLSGLVDALAHVPKIRTLSVTQFYFLHEVALSSNVREVESDDFVRLLLRGDIDISALAAQSFDDDATGFCIPRSDHIDTVLSKIEGDARRFVVSSDFGNGKSVFTKQLSVAALSRGFRVFEVTTTQSELFAEIDQVLRVGDRMIFIIDDVVRHKEAAKYLGARLTNNVTLICTSRGEQDDRTSHELEADLGGAVRYLDLNRLTDQEIADWDRALERWGFWGQRIENSPAQRRQFITNDCGRENRSLILTLFRESELAQRIQTLVQFFVRDRREHLSAFAGLLISSLCQKHVSWESIVRWLNVDETQLRSDIAASEISALFARGRDWNIFTSTQLADFILRKHFLQSDREVLLTVYTKIVLSTSESSADYRSGSEGRGNLKELMKFRFLTKLFGDDADGTGLIGSVYAKLSSAPRIRGNPQFWLQFAMSRMEIGDLETADEYLKTALGLAEQKGKDARERGYEYSSFQILDQRARLYLRRAAADTTRLRRGEVQKAIDDLAALSGDTAYEIVHPMRAVPLINNLLERWVDSIDENLRTIIKHFLVKLQTASQDVDRLPRSQRGETKILKDALRDALLIIRNA